MVKIEALDAVLELLGGMDMPGDEAHQFAGGYLALVRQLLQESTDFPLSATARKLLNKGDV
jgi:hypothetical protein